MTNKRNKQKTLNILFQKACEDGDLEKVQYYLQSPELDCHANIHADKNMAIMLACENAHTHIIDYIIANNLYNYEKVEKSLLTAMISQGSATILSARNNF